MKDTELTPPTEPRESPVRFNAVKYGIYSVSPVIPWFETEEDWFAFRDSIFESIQPQGGLELALADRVALLLWRLMRIARYERESIASSMADVRKDFEANIYLSGQWFDKVTDEMKETMQRMAMHRLLPDDPEEDHDLRDTPPSSPPPDPSSTRSHQRLPPHAPAQLEARRR
jgi:hypothetical protein